ncbi:hypothetical protein GYM70_00535 [Lactobacillus panisapium]|uniref:hypothetical protein n=1 Tax=Lactobacillus panisapium TaxID=2012495 RepID=UPI001C6A6B37|nr:hypothetical protein [Lactobacillus panisapium]QYN53969.1 hypothetical protein GYM70_00535 [Lactobacillus panisapium]
MKSKNNSPQKLLKSFNKKYEEEDYEYQDLTDFSPLYGPVEVAKESKKSEVETRQEAVLIDRDREIINNGALDTNLTNSIIEQEKFKLECAHKIVIGTSIYFCIVTVIIFAIVMCPIYSDTLKSILLGGFFANLVGLLIIIFKYVFSPSKYLFDLLMRLKEYFKTGRK